MHYKVSTYSYLFIFSCLFTGYHSTRLFLAGPSALLERGRGGGPRLAAPPGPRLHRPSSIFSTEFSKISRMASKSAKSVFDFLRLTRSWLRIVAASGVNFSKSVG